MCDPVSCATNPGTHWENVSYYVSPPCRARFFCSLFMSGGYRAPHAVSFAAVHTGVQGVRRDPESFSVENMGLRFEYKDGMGISGYRRVSYRMSKRSTLKWSWLGTLSFLLLLLDNKKIQRKRKLASLQYRIERIMPAPQKMTRRTSSSSLTRIGNVSLH